MTGKFDIHFLWDTLRLTERTLLTSNPRLYSRGFRRVPGIARATLMSR